MEQRDFKGVWIPREIWLNTELSAIEKFIYTEINSLDGDNHCYASNEYLAEFCQCSVATVTRSLKHLMDLNLIEQVSFDGRTRILKVSNKCMPNQIDEAASSKCVTNNIINNKKDIKHDAEPGGIVLVDLLAEKPKKKNLYQQCIDMINEFTNDGKLQELLIMYLDLVIEKYRHEGKTLYANQFKGMLNKLDQVCKDGKYGAIVQQSLDHQYVSFYPVDTYSKPKTYVPDTNKAPQHKAGQKARNEDGTLKEY